MNLEKILSISAAAVLTTLLVVPVALAQQQAVDWAYYNSVPGNWNWSPQKELNKENVRFLEVKWVFPIPASPTGVFLSGSEGVIHTPLVYKGVVYFVTNWHRAYAVDAATGRTLWTRDIPPPAALGDTMMKGAPWQVGALRGHFHQIHIIELDGRPYLFIGTNYWYLFALDVFTGDIRLNWTIFSTDYLAGVPGNRGVYDLSTPSFVIDTSKKIMVIGAGVSEGQGAGRGFFVGVDLKPWLERRGDPQMIWRTFIIPPQDGSDPEWTMKMVDQMRGAWIWDGEKLVNIKTLPAEQKRQLLYDDWGFRRFVERYPNERVSYAGAGAGWGGAYAVDEDRGIVFVGTNQASPDWNATFRPGPNLWSASILAFNIENGQPLWGVQTVAHDLWDWDCAWSVIFLKDVTIGGQRRDAVIKGCKSAVVFALNANDGSLLWAFNPWDPARSGGDPRYGVKPSKYAKFLNPLDPRDMSWNWQGEWTADADYLRRRGAFYQNPPATGSLESDPAYDPTRNRLFVAVYNSPSAFTLANVGPGTGWPQGWGIAFTSLPAQPTNTTLYAIDVATGRVVWNTFIPDVPYRGGLTTSNGLVFATFNDGTVRVYDADNGAEIRRIIIAGPVMVQPSIATTADGKVRVLFPVSNPLPGFWAPTALSGFVVSMGLPDVVAERTVQQTVVQTVRTEVTRIQTAVETRVQTQVQTVVTTRVTEVTVEVIPSWIYLVAAVAVVAVVGAVATAARARRR
ncbi:MAG: PQQ-binding-like beta-propeller repeat protein [Candidatus Caldarchaeum sp.]|nr:PQQ-binding-like beta-propeller repeat protein [Candidatus Caldarchaeum sp.]MDW8360353.1 PQQ-binding-like beta-propeller repeat protein [Candidatus Caldarchaeum sp.]